MLFNELNVKALDDSLSAYAKLTGGRRPTAGWARAIREALGMTRDQLASRIGLRGPSVNTLERSEARGTITLESLDKLARGLGCRVVYAIVPPEGETLESLLRKRAEDVARDRLSRVSHSMKLENQALDPREEKRQLKRAVDSLLAGSRRILWR
jgi:predicted DNA-binding mobile mystery protein A